MAKRVRRTWPLVLGWGIALVAIGGIIALQPNVTPLYWAVRTCALLGYLGAFAAVVSSAYMRQLVRYFGRPFVKTHHALSLASLALVTLHPLAVALNFGSLNVFVPLFDSWIVFLRWGGRVAWYLFVIAALAALLRARFRQQWRAVHMLNYVAFFLATVHAILLGTDLQSVVLKVLAIAMAIVVVVTLVQKRRQRRPKRR
jgi:DMSO/TMAO reductase YedYZ heme-binding membrane subunit